MFPVARHVRDDKTSRRVLGVATRVEPQGNRRSRELVINILIAMVCIFLPFVGHIILTFLIAGDDLSMGHKIIWLLAVWLVPFVGPFLYLLVGQRRHRLFG